MRKPARRKLKPLAPESLYQHCDPALLAFATTAELEDLAKVIGQARAVDAIQFGVGIRHDGYNIFVLGHAGSGRYTLTHKELESRAATGPAPADWCYLNNFEQTNKPRAVKLPAGRGVQFQRHMRQFVEELGSVIPAVFEGEEYRSRIEALSEEFKQRQEKMFEDLGEEARKQGVALIQTQKGFALAPFRNGEIVSPDEFDKLPETEQQHSKQMIQQFDEKLRKIVHQMPRMQREHQTKIREFNRETIALAAGHLIEELRAQYADLPEILAFLDAVRADIIESAGELREQKSADDLTGIVVATPLQRYQVNLLVDHGASAGAPVVFENHPTYQNLLGRIEHLAHMGMLVTNFSLIKGGALHRANGGYLILDAGKLLTQPYAWEGLKRALLAREIRIESLGEIFGLVNTLSLQPQPIPLDLKVVLFGERIFYYLLHQLDPDFADLFKVAADFDDEIERNPESSVLYARMIATLVRRQGLRAFERQAVARLIEHSARLAGDSAKLLTHTRSLNDLLIEADHFAQGAQREVVSAEDVQSAIDAQIHRADRLRKSSLNDILEGTVLIDTDGRHGGQINGLAAINLGNLVFAQPVRITATTRLGEGDVIDIEREVALSGAIHSKGVLILTSFLAARYSHNTPLSLNASLVFEQSYSTVEGDSASLAELCALLSALSGLLINQGLAVTGSVNQYGQVQAIGAVNEKIEGYFDVCNARGLTGRQGVLIPAANVRHLMLRRDVVEAARAGRFHIYAVEDVDQAMELLTGFPAGEPDAEGRVPQGSVNYLVAAQLVQLSMMRQAYSGAPQKRRTVRKKRTSS
ncbi:MAG: AAA family ATPase [Gallionellaceae bacterium]|nr:AAA family ATPase [Gallionellaceae bacterium]